VRPLPQNSAEFGRLKHSGNPARHYYGVPIDGNTGGLAMRRTLPEWVAEWRVSLDLARKVIRRSPALRSLGERFGSTRTYDETEANAIREAVEQRRPGKPGPKPAAVAG
jgi:hypothetical protein